MCAISLTACSSGGCKGDTSVVENSHASADTASLSVDSLNLMPVFEDTDGRLDSIFSVHNYVFGPEIVKASKSGDPDASFILAQMYAYGIAGAKPNRAKAFKLLVNLSDNGNYEAMADAGYMLLYGCGVESDPKKGLDMLTEAANNGCATAYLFMGRFYSDAEPTPENKRNAKLCFAQAYDLGISEAMTLLKKLDD